ncbi:MAG: EamA family transporter [Alphaproteobacteria bacterium]|nr:EamA family transporter [Alphaproteobacteria bacterium]
MLRGILYMLLAVTLFSGLNASVKFLTTDYSTVQVLWLRYTGHIVYVFVLLAPRGALGAIRSNRPCIQLSRSMMMIGATVCYYTALRYVSLPTAAAVNFTSPLMVALLAIPLLGESVGMRRWAAILMGFAGGLVIVRPGLDVVHPAVLLVFGTAFCYGMYQVLTRKVAPYDSSETSIIYTALLGFIFTSLLVPFDFRPPNNWIDALVFFAPGFFGGLSHFCLVKAYENGPASAISPYNYTQLVGSVTLSVIIFDEFPDFWTWVGCGIIIASGLYLMHRESIAQRASANTGTGSQ